MSKIKIFLYDFEIYGLDKFPKEDQFRFQQSGDCTVTGYLEYKNQEEASIYSEGIVVEDTSHDPLLHVIDYPHNASEERQKYMKYFNSTIVSKFILEKTFNLSSSQNYLWSK